MFRKLIRDKVCLFCLFMLILFAAAAVLAPWLSPNDPNEIHYTDRFAGISGMFPLKQSTGARLPSVILKMEPTV